MDVIKKVCSDKRDGPFLQKGQKEKLVPYIRSATSESKIGFENRDPGFELKTETGFQN